MGLMRRQRRLGSGERTEELKERIGGLKGADDMLRQQREETQVIFDSVPALIFFKDRENRLIRVNRAFADAMGLPKEKIEGKTCYELWPEQAEGYWKDDREVLVSRKPKRNIIEPMKTSRGTRWLMTDKIPYEDARGDIVGVIGFSIDITERKRAEEALRGSEEKYRELVQNANSIILKADMNGNITFFNEFAQRFFGYAEDEVVGKNLVGTIVPKTDAAGRDLGTMIHDVVMRPDNYVNNENENVRRNGERVWISWTNKTIRDKEGRTIGILCIGNDITDRKRKEEQLLHMQRIEAVGTLTGSIAHDFNNILAGLMGYASLMRMDMKKESPLIRDLDAIEKLLQRGASLSRKLLEFSRRKDYHPGPIDINLVIKDVLGVLAQTAAKEIDVVSKLSPGIPSIVGDESEIHQVIMNICLNACEAMIERGTLTVKTADVEIDRGFLKEHPQLKRGRYVSVAISDTGIGMDEQEIGHIFEPFFTTKAKRLGTGLGLAIVRSIVEKHGGCITVESAPWRGSTFTIYFPASAEKISRAKSAAVKRLVGDETILIVDDEKDFRESARRWLSELGYMVIEAASGEEAVRIVQGRKVKIDLVILDMVMKGMGGARAFKRIREAARDLPIIICTGYIRDRSSRRILEKEASDFIRKPFAFSELSPRIRKILDGRLL